ncbi:hypothetical protein HPB49_000101 [Dermacentor silvarum]|uniref:Uncharacterized protein n=1 Tax=Dermacentor silvarum TaxID=543639 RepID=A0ACB8C6I0_DERSI|nr:hypothetical protein HPB49_000101 [Dermacentor silvarum]
MIAVTRIGRCIRVGTSAAKFNFFLDSGQPRAASVKSLRQKTGLHFDDMATTGSLQLLNMSFIKGAAKTPRAEDASSSNSVSRLASLWRQWFCRPDSNARIPGQFVQRIGVVRGGAEVPGGYRGAALQGIGASSPPPAYSADFEGIAVDNAVSWLPTVALVTTALAALLLIGGVGLFMMNEDIAANIWPHEEHDSMEYNDLEPISWSPPSDNEVHMKILARGEKISTHRGTVGASRSSHESSTRRSGVHHHGPRYADEDAASETTGKETEAPAVATHDTPETTEETTWDPHNEPTKHGCSSALHTYCVKVRDEYYYQPAVNACVMTATDSTVVCNHSRNKFASHASCRKNCVESPVPADKCFHTAIFSKCTRHDVRHKWWYFDGSRCQSWDFPLGACPSLTDADGGDAFASRHECAQYCGDGARDHRHSKRRCLPPVREPCTAQQLRFPYFAVGVPNAGSGVFRCVKASGAVLAHHRCPTGENRFPTKEDCAKMCLRLPFSEDLLQTLLLLMVHPICHIQGVMAPLANSPSLSDRYTREDDLD